MDTRMEEGMDIRTEEADTDTRTEARSAQDTKTGAREEPAQRNIAAAIARAALYIIIHSHAIRRNLTTATNSLSTNACPARGSRFCHVPAIVFRRVSETHSRELC